MKKPKTLNYYLRNWVIRTRFTLLSNLDFEQQQRAFKECSYDNLGCIINDCMWGEYFLPTTLHVMDIMHPSSYLYLLQRINDKMYSSEENKSVYNGYNSFHAVVAK